LAQLSESAASVSVKLEIAGLLCDWLDLASQLILGVLRKTAIPQVNSMDFVPGAAVFSC
jgi:hypothetical protein